MHDAVLSWAYGANKTLAQGFPANDGFKVTGNIINQVLEGITGKVIINANGDRLLNQRYNRTFD